MALVQVCFIHVEHTILTKGFLSFAHVKTVGT